MNEEVVIAKKGKMKLPLATPKILRYIYFCFLDIHGFDYSQTTTRELNIANKKGKMDN